MDKKRWHLLISGRVQGVYYRASTEKRAAELGLTGYARNLPSGQVEVVAEGSEGQLHQLHEWCKGGPPDARVDAIEITEQPPSGAFTDFSVR
ncbi:MULTISPECIES: acylphosphatase [Marinobacter]|uniref:acylphosphatase n=1 Tax=Marinobacter metalliresistant TaxID=2961995 RepID=A0ABZ2W7N8_9GAMM|nr:acylphosphatase [Marinobacter sp. Arc7-DN-1]AXS81779.1 acylphosphatase [Marinobacter sp. Arc7-DN-1]